MVRRIKRGISPFSPDKTHLHHILVDFISSEDRDSATRKSVLFLFVMQSIFGCAGFMIDSYVFHHEMVPFLALFVFGVIFLVVYNVFTKAMRH